MSDIEHLIFSTIVSCGAARFRYFRHKTDTAQTADSSAKATNLALWPMFLPPSP
jgi:hypothetical protein